MVINRKTQKRKEGDRAGSGGGRGRGGGLGGEEDRKGRGEGKTFFENGKILLRISNHKSTLRMSAGWYSYNLRPKIS